MEVTPELLNRLNGGTAPEPLPPDIRATPYTWIDPEAIPRRQWLHGRHLIRRFISVTVAAGGVGKTTEIIAEALELVTGFTLVTNHKGDPRRVWLWNGEDPTEEIQRRIQAACLHYNIGEGDIGGRLFVDSGRQMPIIVASELKGTLQIATPIIDGVKQAISDNGIDVLVIDPFVRCHRVPENDNGKINAVAEVWASIADETNCAIDLVHHIRKTTGEVSTDDARGAVALIDAGRSSRAFNRMTRQEGEEAGVENHLLFFRINDGKVNLAPPSEAAEWRELKSISLGNDNGGPADLVGVATRWKWPDVLDGVSLEDLREFQNRLSTGDYRVDPRAKEWAGNMLAELLGWDAEDASVRKSLKKVLTKWGATGAIREVKRLDEKRMSRKFYEKGSPA
jgi:hypothetical protein